MNRELGGGAWIRLEDDFLARAEADEARAALLDEIAWSQGEITMFGKTHKEPRLSAWYGDAGARYTYSGRALEPLAWTPRLADLAGRASAFASDATGERVRFDSMLANLYRTGADGMGFHADDEPELGENPVIGSLSLGATRRFVLKPKRGAGAPVSLDLAHGSLLVMGGTTQHRFVHGVPKSTRAEGPRINLTFRTIARSGQCS